jgi:hypothetical protein
MTRILALLVIALAAAACATPEQKSYRQQVRAEENRMGRVTRIQALFDTRDAREQGGDPSGQRVTVLLENEQVAYISQAIDPALKVGDLVRIEGTGRDARVVRR